MRKRLYWDFFWLFVFSLSIGFLVFVGSCEAYAEKTKPTLAERLESILDSVHVAPPPVDRPETDDELHERLHEIAEDAAYVAKGNASDALLLLAVDDEESGFALDVDKGPCRPGTCDSGRAYCSLQIWAKDAEAGQKLFDDRRACFSYGLEILHNSQSACMGLGKELAFSAYAAGTCDSEKGHEGSKRLYAYWQRWRDRYTAVLARERGK